MAEKPKEDIQEESDTGSVNIEKKKEYGDLQSPVNGANHEAEVTEGEKSPVPPVDEVGDSADKQPTTKGGESPVQIEEKDVKSNAEDEQEDEGTEGSKLYKCSALCCERVHHRLVD